MAEFFFNKLTKNNYAESCGVYPYYYLKKYHARVPKWEPVIRVMKEQGIDVSKSLIKKADKSKVKDADIIIVIMEKSMADKDLPNYIKKSKKFKLWEIRDIRGTSKFDYQYNKYKENRDKIFSLVVNLIKSLDGKSRFSPKLL
ncbi:hypothetical protein J4411_01960 [Candidatus Pacearchaeota archaeon]|nr:hypothetical protein [Candidatus Pacearchaeota archaeon]